MMNIQPEYIWNSPVFERIDDNPGCHIHVGYMGLGCKIIFSYGIRYLSERQKQKID
jgi:hypothetical protein